MGLQDLADVHAGRYAERIQNDFYGATVGQERHVLHGEDLGDYALVPVASRHLVAFGDFALLRDHDLYQSMNAGRQLGVLVTVKDLDLDHAAPLAVRHPQRSVLYLARLLAEDRPQQPLLGGELGLAFRRDLADQDVAR